MDIPKKLLLELQNRLKVGNRRGVHLNAIPGRISYKFDISRLSHIEENLPEKFVEELLSKVPFKFKISWKDNVPDLNLIDEEDEVKLVQIKRSFDNLINQTKSIESEKGVNTFGFGFPIISRRDQADNKLTVAPILIWSLTIKKSSKEFNTWEIERNEEDPIYVNEVLINHLKSDSKLDIDKLSNEFLDDGIVDKDELIEVCVNLLESINSTVDSNLKSVFEEKLLKIKPISNKKYFESLPLTYNNSKIDFSGLFSIFEVQKQNVIIDYDELFKSHNLFELESVSIDFEKLLNNSFQSLSYVETDPSQQQILNSLEETRNILIQGPPGTGKSQSLSAILVNALENHKKTVVVCEKKTALEVLYNSLLNMGLEHLCVLLKDVTRDRRQVVNSVRNSLEKYNKRHQSKTYSRSNLDYLINKANVLINEINKNHNELDQKLLGEKNWTFVVGELLKEIRDFDDSQSISLDDYKLSYESSELNTILDKYDRAEKLFKKFKPFEHFRIFDTSIFSRENHFELEDAIKRDFKFYESVIENVKLNLSDFKLKYFEIRKNQFHKQLKTINKILDEIEIIYENNKDNKEFLNHKKVNSKLFSFLSFFSNRHKLIIQDYHKLDESYKSLASECINLADIPNFEYKGYAADQHHKYNKYRDDLFSLKDQFVRIIEEDFSLLNLLKKNNEIYETDEFISINDKLLKLKEKIFDDNWLDDISLNTSSHNSLIIDINKKIEEFKKYFSYESDVFYNEYSWFNFYNNLSNQEISLLSQLYNKENWKKILIVSYLKKLLLKSANEHIPRDDENISELNHVINDLGIKQIEYINKYWFGTQKYAVEKFARNHSFLSVNNLYNKKSSKNHKRRSLRQIIDFDIDLFTSFFPIVLTTPDVCSNLFQGRRKYFDIVMFDEASQLRLEDNFPALLKGKQIIIAGDEHQMPPSNYFSKIMEGEFDEDEDESGLQEEQIFEESLLSAESLLDFAEELKFDKRYLDFHYRSKHPFLIDFSNHAFYNKRLKPVPNNFEYIPIKYTHVDGTYSNNSNEAEAETVLSIIEKNINRFPDGKYPSVGVATFNIHQRNLILSKISERKNLIKFKEFNDKIFELEQNEEESFFVKNLENIQGDERDVIIISTTYGINDEGKFYNRFGSINQQKGYKLLNVIVTRAKFKIYLCTSIPEKTFLNYREHLFTQGSNNRKAVFFAYLAYAKAVSEKNHELRNSVLECLTENTNKSESFNDYEYNLESPFEEEVFQVLLENFDSDKLETQYQFAGFRIDMVYDPKIKGVPKIAIECDGASYHSSREAYVHDMYRQKILEEHGFKFHRIWSLNWWRNNKKEAQKLIEFIKSFEIKEPVEFKNYDAYKNVFEDEVNILPNLKDLEDNIDVSEVFTDKEIGESTFINKKISSNEIKVSLEPKKPIIKIGSKVRVKYLNNGNELKVHIVESENNKRDANDTYIKLFYKSALGASLIDHCQGDNLRVGKLDTFVEVLEILD